MGLLEPPAWPDVAVPAGPPPCALDADPNPYLGAVLAQGVINAGFGEWPLVGRDDPRVWSRRFASRRRLVGEYAWAIPNERALAAIAALSPIVEVGAGGGYWAHLLRQRGADVAAYDPATSHLYVADGSGQRVGLAPRREWGGVRASDHRAVAAFEHRTMLLVWPAWDGWASAALALFRGERVAYVGEDAYGATAEPAFFELLDRDFELEAVIEIPQWVGLRDSLSIWRRRPAPGLSIRTVGARELERDRLRRRVRPRSWSDANG